MTKALLAASLLACAPFAASAQDAAAAPEFEVASVKPSPPPQPGVSFMIGCRAPDPGRFECMRTPLRMLVVQAYGVANYRVTGPAWMDSERYDIVATVPDGASKEQIDLMLRKLLADRLGLVAHRETKELQTFALTVGKNGPKLKESKEGSTLPPSDPPPPGSIPAFSAPGGAMPVQTGGQVVMMQSSGPPPANVRRVGRSVRQTVTPDAITAEATGMDLPGLADMLENRLGRHVVDETGLKGKYDFSLRYANDSSLGSSGIVVRGAAGGPPPALPSADSASDPAPSIFTAVQDQLGLKLEPKKLPTEIVVVDKADKVPTAN